MSGKHNVKNVWLIVLLVSFMMAAVSCTQRMPGKYHETAAKGAAVVGDITIGEPVYHAGLTVFPLYREGAVNVVYKTLDQALDDGSVEIKELDGGASVPALQVVNKGRDKVIIIGGEELVGARQNRIVNTTMILDANSKTTIPVSCVEAGRWTEVSESFNKGEMANAKMRAANVAGVQKSVKAGGKFEAGQERVWNDVDELNVKLGVKTETSAMHDGIQAMEKKLNAFVQAFKMDDKAVGYIAFAGHTPIGMDLFATPQVFRHKWEDLLKSAALDILSLDEKPAPATVAAATDFLKAALDNVGQEYAPPGLGRGYHIQSHEVVGNVVRYKGGIAHISAFPAPENNGDAEFDNMDLYLQQRNYRNEGPEFIMEDNMMIEPEQGDAPEELQMQMNDAPNRRNQSR